MARLAASNAAWLITLFFFGLLVVVVLEEEEEEVADEVEEEGCTFLGPRPSLRNISALALFFPVFFLPFFFFFAATFNIPMTLSPERSAVVEAVVEAPALVALHGI